VTEIRDNPRPSVRKLHGTYVDFYGRPSTEEAYLAQFIDGGELGEAPTTTREVKREIAGSGVPYENELLADGYVYTLSLPATQKDLTKTKGIGTKGAKKIAAWVDEHWGLEIE